MASEDPGKQRIQRKHQREKNSKVNAGQSRQHEGRCQTEAIGRVWSLHVAIEKKNREWRPAHSHRVKVHQVVEMKRTVSENESRGDGAPAAGPKSPSETSGTDA